MAKSKTKKNKNNRKPNKKSKEGTGGCSRDGDNEEHFPTDPLCFQDVMKGNYRNDKTKKTKAESKNKSTNDDVDDQEDNNDSIANVFFELANATYISYRLPPPPSLPPPSPDHLLENDQSRNTKRSNGDENNSIIIQQDLEDACGKHTGGIVWETSYLLLEYLKSTYSTKNNMNCTNFLEVGAGCGLVGLGVYKMNLATEHVFLTETSEVMPNLVSNVQRNTSSAKTTANTITDDDNGSNDAGKDDDDDDDKDTSRRLQLHTCCLDWTSYKEDCQKADIVPHSMDVIVGTDVVFCPELVVPLLATLRYLSHPKTTILLCLQERCKDSYQMLLKEAHAHELHVEDVTTSIVEHVSECSWGNELECKLLEFSIMASSKTKKKEKKKESKKRKKKKRKRDKNDTSSRGEE